ncbi:MAG: LacI family DNA-binding transcriptional regulator, partial [Planctomycetota bacterium]
MPARPNRRVTMRDIAQASGTSPATVSLALADSPQIAARTRVRILALCEELGYSRSHLRRSSNRGTASREKPTRRFGFFSVGAGLDEETLAPFLQALTRETTRQSVRLELAASDSNEPL